MSVKSALAQINSKIREQLAREATPAVKANLVRLSIKGSITALEDAQKAARAALKQDKRR
jgi:hypothetical protein